MAKTKNELKEITIIGIDSSTSCTGISVISKLGKIERLVFYDKFSPPENSSYEEKVLFIFNNIRMIYEDYKEHTPIVAIELLNSPKNLNTTRKLAGLWAFIKVGLYDLESVSVASLNTATVKLLATGDGRADKYKMVKYVNSYFKLNLKYHKSNKEKSDDDIADAIGVALATSRLLDKGDLIEKYF